MRRILLALGVVAALAALVLVRLGAGPPADESPHPFNQDRNAVWLEHRWLEKDHDEGEIEALVAALQSRGIRYAFPHLIPFNAAGRLPPHSRDQLRRFIATARRVAPSLQVLPWVGGLRVGYRRTRAGTIDLTDLGQRQRIVAECRGLVDDGFDGIHLNVEPVANGDMEFLALLRALRTAVGPERALSVSAIRPGPFPLPFAPNFVWTPDYYARLAATVDQVVVMAYDTALPTPALYRRYLAWAAGNLTHRLAAPGDGARVLMGLPTYDETGLMHRGDVETLSNGLFGVIAGLRGLGAGGTFEGVALYAEWTTDAAEWAAYERIWRGRGTPARPPSTSR
jgi:hypothetical protein